MAGTDFGARMIRAFEAGRQAREADARRQQEAEDRKLEREMLQQRIRQSKIEEKIQARQIARGEALQRQPETMQFPDIGMTPGTEVAPAQGGRPAVSTNPIRAMLEQRTLPSEAAPIPGIEEFGIPAGTETRNFGDIIRQQLAAQAAEPVTLSPGQQRFVGGRPVASVPALPPRPVPVALGGTLVNPQSGAKIFEAPARAENLDQLEAAFQRQFNRLPTFEELKKMKMELASATRPPAAQSTVVIQTVDAQGNPVTRIVPKTAGAEYAKPMTAGEREDVSNLQTMHSQLNRLDELVTKHSAKLGGTFGYKSRITDWLQQATESDPEINELAQLSESLSAMRVFLLSGKQVAEWERKRLEKINPTLRQPLSGLQTAIKVVRDTTASAIRRRGRVEPTGAAPVGGGGIEIIRDANGRIVGVK